MSVKFKKSTQWYNGHNNDCSDYKNVAQKYKFVLTYMNETI